MTKKTIPIPPGYKLTKIGVLPVEWEAKRIRDLEATVTSGSRGWAEYYDEDGNGLFIRITNLDRNNLFLNFSKNKYVNLPHGTTEGKRTRLHEGDILISITADLGIIGYWKTTNHPEAYINQHVSMIRIMDRSVDKLFTAYQLSSPLVQRLIQVQCDQGAKAGLNLSSVNNIQIPLPPLPQQQKIAQILATWDHAITTQTQLIDAKKEQKRGLMQRLLTGEVRLPGFEGELFEQTIDEFGTTFNGLTGKNKESFGAGEPYISYMNVFKNTFVDFDISDFVEIGPTDNQNVVITGDIIFTVSSETPSEVGMSSAVLNCSGQVYLNSFCFGLRPKNKDSVDFKYLGYYFRSQEMRKKISSLAQGSTRFNLSKGNFKKLVINLPQKEEQEAIANILFTADREIHLLETRLTEFREQKRGLMQRLLTGQVRVTP